MGLCSAKIQLTKSKSSKHGILTNKLNKCENSFEQFRAFKSDRSIQTNWISNLTPIRQGQLGVSQNQLKKSIKRITWADQQIDNNQCCGIMKIGISIKKIAFSKHYTIVGKSNAFPDVKLNKEMILVEHNLSGDLRIAQLTKKDKDGTELVNQIVRSQLEHPNLLRIFDIFSDGNNFQIIHDFYADGQLSKNIEEKPYTQQQAAIEIKQIIDVVLYLHQNNLHHDYLCLSSFSNCIQLNSKYIILTEFKSIFIKSIPNHNEYIYYLSPEAIKIKDMYSPERDFWSIGIILYKMLTGKYPFKGDNPDQIYQSIQKHFLSNVTDFSLIPLECQELIKSFLQINPKQRIKLSQALDHQWFQNNIFFSENEFYTIVKQLGNFLKFSFLQRCFLQFMISTFQQKQEQQLYQHFCQLDANHDGLIDKKDLTQAYLKFNSNLHEVEELINTKYKEFDFKIDFQEYKIGVVDKLQLLTVDNLKLTFEMLTDTDGFITLQKLINLYPNKKEQLKTQFQQYEQNQINQQKFEELMYDTL